MTIQEILTAHRMLHVSHLAHTVAMCKCGTLFENRLAHRAHVAEVLDKHMQEREVALLSEVADEAIEKYADKPYSPGHVIRLLLSRANELRKAATNGR